MSDMEDFSERYIDLEDDLMNAGAMITRHSRKVREPVFLASVLEILQHLDLLDDPAFKDTVIEDIIKHFHDCNIADVKDLEGIIEYFRDIEELPKEEEEAVRVEAAETAAESTAGRDSDV